MRVGRDVKYRGSMTAAAFKRVVKEFPGLSDRAKACAKAVLVDGITRVNAADQFGVSPQLVGRWCLQIYRAAPPPGVGVDDFNRAVAQFPRLSKRTKELVRAVLVDGLSESEASRQFGVSRQMANEWCTKIKRTLLATKGWVTQTVTLPSDKMREVKQMQADAISRRKKPRH